MADITPLQQAALSAQIAFYAVTAAGLVLAALLGVVKYRVFRTGRPFISISLEASSRPCSDSHVQIGVTARLHNGSQVLATADTLEWECRAIGTYDADDIDAKIAEYFSSPGVRNEPGYSQFPWDVQQRVTKKNHIIEIEPNAFSYDNVSFIVPAYCTAVQIRLYIPAGKRRDLGWMGIAYHDTRTP